MLFRNRAAKPNILLAIGLLALSVASGLRALDHRNSIPDGMLGFLFGIAIGLIIVSYWRRRQCRPTD